MSDRGIRNNGKSLITVSASVKGGKDIYLVPGLNRLTREQHRRVLENKVVASYLRVGLLSEVDAPPVEKAAGYGEAPAQVNAPPPTDKPLEKMNKAELVAVATEMGLYVDEAATNATIREAILAAKQL